MGNFCWAELLTKEAEKMADASIDLYIPRKCSATNRVITSKDHASVQLNIAHVDANGVYQGDYETVAFSGFVRFHSGADQAMNRIAAEKALMKDLASFPAEHEFSSDE